MKEKPTEKQLFDALISQTAYGIWVSLGKLQNPVSGETSIDLTQASIQIDMLDMINNKMHASLTDEEREYIDKLCELCEPKNKDIDKGVLKSFLKLVQPRLETINKLKERFLYLFERPATDEPERITFLIGLPDCIESRVIYEPIL